MMQPQPYGYINGMQIDRIVPDVKTYLKKSDAYLSTLILVKVIKMVADNMPIKFSNNTWIDILKEDTSIRGLQHAFSRLERTVLPGFTKPILSRTFADAAKRNRTEFRVDVDQLIYLLRIKESDVKDMPRGSLEKHFFYQSGLKVRDYLKDLKKANKLKERKDFNTNPELQEKYEKIMQSIKERQEEFELHVRRIFNRVNKAMNQITIVNEALKNEARKILLGLLHDNGYMPPDAINN